MLIIVIHFIRLLRDKLALICSQSPRKFAWLQFFHLAKSFIIISIEHLSLLNLIFKIALVFLQLLLSIYGCSRWLPLHWAHNILILLVHAVFIFVENPGRILGSVVRGGQRSPFQLTFWVETHPILVHHILHFLGVWLLLRLELWRPIVLETFLLKYLSNRQVLPVNTCRYLGWLSAIWLVGVALLDKPLVGRSIGEV